jgi:hypothetical protein
MHWEEDIYVHNFGHKTYMEGAKWKTQVYVDTWIVFICIYLTIFFGNSDYVASNERVTSE